MTNFAMDKKLSNKRRREVVARLAGGESYGSIAREFKITPMSVWRWWQQVDEVEKRQAAGDARLNAAIAATDKLNAQLNDGELDVAATYGSLAKRVDALISKAEATGDDAFALAAMEGLRKVLRDIASMEGRLKQNLTVEVKLSESPEWVAMRQILLDVIEEVPAAREPLLRHMRDRRLSITKEETPVL